MSNLLIKNIGLLATPLGTAAKSGAQQGAVQFLYDAFVRIEDGIITDVRFIGGCSGNTQGVSALAIGMTPGEVVRRIKGIKCGPKSTSCPDQLATALEEYLASKEA